MKIKLILAASILLVSGQANAALIPSDVAFSIDGLTDIAPIIYRVSTSSPPQPSDFVTVDRGFTVAYGSSFDITARLTNTGSSLITFVESNPPTAIGPTVADIIT